MFVIKNRDLENLEELSSLKNQIEETRLQDNLGKRNFHENIRKKFEPVTDTIENTSEILVKILTDCSSKNNQALENLNNRLLEIMNDRGIIASYLLSPVSKIDY